MQYLWERQKLHEFRLTVQRWKIMSYPWLIFIVRHLQFHYTVPDAGAYVMGVYSNLFVCVLCLFYWHVHLICTQMDCIVQFKWKPGTCPSKVLEFHKLSSASPTSFWVFRQISLDFLASVWFFPVTCLARVMLQTNCQLSKIATGGRILGLAS